MVLAAYISNSAETPMVILIDVSIASSFRERRSRCSFPAAAEGLPTQHQRLRVRVHLYARVLGSCNRALQACFKYAGEVVLAAQPAAILPWVLRACKTVDRFKATSCEVESQYNLCITVISSK